jgi:hypothetical protein
MRLLVVGCSKTKSAAPGPLPARERYNGMFWKVIRRALRECSALEQDLDIIVISAAFGAIESHLPIPWYERRMTRDRAGEAREQVVALLNDHLMRQAYDDILICLGATYRLAIAGASLESAQRTAGSIGKQAQQLKWWLHRTEMPLVDKTLTTSRYLD